MGVSTLRLVVDMWRIASTLLLCAVAIACAPEAPQSDAVDEDDAADNAGEQNAVVVYAAYEDKTYLPALFNRFTQETGTVVIVRNGEVPGIVDDVILKRTEPPADVLITPSVAGAWRVAEESEFRPNYSAAVESLPAVVKDPDKYWTALSYRTAVVVYDSGQVTPAELGAYEHLADESFRNKLCLTSSESAINRAVIAMLINKLGRREAELAVRGWVANLARPVFDSAGQLLQAINAGECAVGIVSSDTLAGSRLAAHSPQEVYFDIEAAGVTRHARNPDAGVALVEWLLGEEIQAHHASQTGRLPVTDPAGLVPIVSVAAGLEEAVKLAERARYR